MIVLRYSIENASFLSDSIGIFTALMNGVNPIVKQLSKSYTGRLRLIMLKSKIMFKFAFLKPWWSEYGSPSHQSVQRTDVTEI